MVLTSKLWTINLWDFLQGLILSVSSSVLVIVYDTIKSGSLLFDWNEIALTALTTGLAYLIKKFATPDKIIISPTDSVTTEDIQRALIKK